MFKKTIITIVLLLQIVCISNVCYSEEQNIDIKNGDIKILRIGIEPILLNLFNKFSDNFYHPTSYVKINNSNERLNSMRKICQNEEVSFLIVMKPLNDYEKFLCSNYNGEKLVEEKIGYYAFVFITSNSNDSIELTSSTIFKALSIHSIKNYDDQSEQYQSWNEIHKNFPDTTIKIYGPFVESVEFEFLSQNFIINQCMANPYNQEKFQDFLKLQKFCQEIKKDGTYVGDSIDGRVIVEKIFSEKESYGIVPYNVLQNNKNTFIAKRFNGVEPSKSNILNGKYPLSYPIFIYHKANISNNLVKDFLTEIKNNNIIGEDGLLTNHGLISLESNTQE